MLTVSYCAEAIGAVRAAKKAGIPVSYMLFSPNEQRRTKFMLTLEPRCIPSRGKRSSYL